jgi:hypothetical protein
MLKHVIEPGTEWTSPDNRGICGFCGKEEGGYALRDENGKWQPACWPCAKPKNAVVPQRKRATVGTVYTDVDADEPEEKKKKNPGMAPCKSRPKVL